MSIRVLIVDDQKMQRRALEAMLSEDACFEVSASLGNAELAVSYCRKYPVDLVLMDVVMSVGINGIEAMAKIKERDPKIKILLVTSMPEASYLSRARQAGADSFWYKEYEGEPLLEVMKRTMDGERIYPDAAPELPLGQISSGQLTDSELAVLRRVVTGATDQEIADSLHLSVWTVRTHIQHMLQKTGYKNRVELAVKAGTSGLVIEG